MVADGEGRVGHPAVFRRLQPQKAQLIGGVHPIRQLSTQGTVVELGPAGHTLTYRIVRHVPTGGHFHTEALQQLHRPFFGDGAAVHVLLVVRIEYNGVFISCLWR